MSKHNERIFKIIRKGINARPQEGQGLAEYSLLLGLVAVVVIGIIGYLGVQLTSNFNSVANALGTPVVAGTPDATTQPQATAPAGGGDSGGSGGGSGGSGGSGASGGSGGGSGSGGSGSGNGVESTTAASTTAPVTTAAITTAAPATTAPTTTAPTTAAPTATPVPTTAAPTTAAPTTAAPTTAAPTATPKPSTAAPTTAAPTTAAPTTAAPTTAAPTTVTSENFGVNYSITNSWNNGYNISLDVINKSKSMVTSWTISWKLDNKETLQNAWNANCTISGDTVTCTNMSYNNKLTPNGGSQNFGAQINSSTGAVTQPLTFTVNGQTVSR